MMVEVRAGKDFRVKKCSQQPVWDTKDYSLLINFIKSLRKIKELDKIIQLIYTSIGIRNQIFQITIPIVFSLDRIIFSYGQRCFIPPSCWFYIAHWSSITLSSKRRVTGLCLTIFELRLDTIQKDKLEIAGYQTVIMFWPVLHVTLNSRIILTEPLCPTGDKVGIQSWYEPLHTSDFKWEWNQKSQGFIT